MIASHRSQLRENLVDLSLKVTFQFFLVCWNSPGLALPPSLGEANSTPLVVSAVCGHCQIYTCGCLLCLRPLCVSIYIFIYLYFYIFICLGVGDLFWPDCSLYWKWFSESSDPLYCYSLEMRLKWSTSRLPKTWRCMVSTTFKSK